jgi:predicted dehydrogenase
LSIKVKKENLMSEELRIGVLGLGLRALGTGFLDLFHRPDDGVHIVAAADPNPVRQAQFRGKPYGNAWLTDAAQPVIVHRDVNALLVLTPEYLHAAHAGYALAEGKHVFLEKPMATSVAEATAILRTARRSTGTLTVGHNMRYMPFVRAIKETIDRGAIGSVVGITWPHAIPYGGDAYFCDWHAERRYVNSLLFQKGCHDLDLIAWFGGSRITRVTATGSQSVYHRSGKRPTNEPVIVEDIWWGPSGHQYPPLQRQDINPNTDVEDIAMMLLELENGALAYYGQMHFSPHSRRGAEIVGTEGAILWDQLTAPVLVRDRDRPNHPADRMPIVYETRDGGHGGGDPEMVDEWISIVRGLAKPSVTPADAWRAVAVAEAATVSMRTDQSPRRVAQLHPQLETYFASTTAK